MLKWFAASKSAHEDISQNVELLRTRSRDLYSGGAPLGKGAIDRIVLNALGSGLRLNVRIDPRLLNMSEQQAIDWAAKTEAEFDYWASSKLADHGQEMTFYELQQLALKSILIDGECLAIL
ncbi:MAG: phage portal protein, partial [Synergistaceae bacterium]|nr:phage portal protein [Synergistaceae bacterium]